jgi:proline iminopeptidase
MSLSFLFLFLVVFLISCSQQGKFPSLREYFSDDEKGVKTGGIKLIPIETPKGVFKVWTKRFGNNPRIKVLLLHGEAVS